MLADGTVPVTAFLPDDRAFRVLVQEITGDAPASDEAAFAAVAGLGIDTVEAVLLYDVIPGATIDSAAAAASDGAALTTALGADVTVRVNGPGNIRLVDADLGDREPRSSRCRRLDLYAGNEQIADGIMLVLRPVDIRP